MSEQPKEIKHWTARLKTEVVMDIIEGNTTAAETARSHDLTVGEVERWMDDFVSMGTEALRSHPRDAEARHKAKEKEVWKVTRDVLGRGHYILYTLTRNKNQSGSPRDGREENHQD